MTPFLTKEAAVEAAHALPCAGPVFISTIDAKIENVQPGWYVGYPSNIGGRLIDAKHKNNKPSKIEVK